MRLRILNFSLLLVVCLSACTPSAPPVLPTPSALTVYSTYAAEPWLSELYDCAGTQTVLERVSDPGSAQIRLQVGEANPSPFAYQIDTEELLIVTQRQSPVQNLSLAEVRAYFLGQGDPTVQLWSYAPGEDVMDAFNRLVLEDGAVGSVSPSAHIAATPQEMSDLLINQPNTLGILPRHWKAGDSREVFNAGAIPVLALTPNEPQAVVKDLIACLQS